MTLEDDKMLELSSITEQAEAMLPDLARLIGTFYNALITNAVPEDLAKQLVIDWYWAVIMQQPVDQQPVDDD